MSTSLRRKLTRIQQGAIKKQSIAGVEAEAKKTKKLIQKALGKRFSKGSPSGSFPARRSGELRDAIDYKVKFQAGTLAVSIGVLKANAKLRAKAEIQERGGIINAKGSRLSIPLDAVLDRNGLPRFKPRRGMKQAFPKGTFTRNNIIFGRRKQGKAIRIVPLFALRTKVKVRARPYLRPFMGPFRTAVREAIKRAIKKVLK